MTNARTTSERTLSPLAPAFPAYILAGGRSVRFGSDKARALLDGVALLVHAATSCAPLASQVTVVAAESDAYLDLGFRTLADRTPGLGPLAGLCRALEDAEESWVMMMSCDLLGVNPSWWRTLADQRAGGLAVCFHTERWQPFPGLYHRELLPLVKARLRAGKRSLRGLLEAADAVAVPPPEGWRLCKQVNRLSDLEEHQSASIVVAGNPGGKPEDDEKATHVREIVRWTSRGSVSREDFVAVEQPMEIRIGRFDGVLRDAVSLSISMRTPGDDEALALGFLFSEGVIDAFDDVKEVVRCGAGPDNLWGNVMRVELRDEVRVDVAALRRNVYTTSSCGLCGKRSLDGLEAREILDVRDDDWSVSSEILQVLPAKLRERQAVFEKTGGLHAVATFSADGTLLEVCEDVGRHNALDKLIGRALRDHVLPLRGRGLLLSGRASFELVQKAAFAQIPLVAAIGAPSSAAIDLAERSGITLIGFLREEGFNLYSGAERVAGPGPPPDPKGDRHHGG